MQKPKSFPSALDAVHVVPAAPVQSEVCSHTVKPGEAQVAAHVVPVNAVHSGHDVPQVVVSVVGMPWPQQMAPAEPAPAQSMASSHCQTIELATGHAAPTATHVDALVEPTGTSQHCWPGAHVWVLPASLTLKGQ